MGSKHYNVKLLKRLCKDQSLDLDTAAKYIQLQLTTQHGQVVLACNIVFAHQVVVCQTFVIIKGALAEALVI